MATQTGSSRISRRRQRPGGVRLHHLVAEKAAAAARPCSLPQSARVFLSFGDPQPFAARIKEAGAKLICQVQTRRDAAHAIACGADIIVAQGSEAGVTASAARR